MIEMYGENNSVELTMEFDSTASTVLEHYRLVKSRMADLPLYHSVLDVDLVGWQNLPAIDNEKNILGKIGVLITPWCMNVMVVPDLVALSDSVDCQPFPDAGENWQIQLTGGLFEFVSSADTGFGKFASSSLISVMHQFESQAQAVTFAMQSLQYMLNETSDNSSQDKAADDLQDSASKIMNTGAIKSENNLDVLPVKTDKKISRRALFTQFMPK